MSTDQAEAVFSDGARVPAVWPEVWRDREELEAGELQKIEVQRAALRFLMGQESRSMREVAASLETSAAVISYHFTTLSRELGFARFLKSAAARVAYKEAARRRWRQRKGPASANPTGQGIKEASK